MRIKEDYTEEAAIAFNIISLIDIVFFLLIFFLAATTFSREERQVGIQLPQTSLPQPMSAPPPQLIINVMADGTIRVGQQAYDRRALEALLRELIKDEPDREVLVRADERSIHKYFADVASLCRQAGVNELKIGYLSGEPR